MLDNVLLSNSACNVLNLVSFEKKYKNIHTFTLENRILDPKVWESPIGNHCSRLKV